MSSTRVASRAARNVQPITIIAWVQATGPGSSEADADRDALEGCAESGPEVGAKPVLQQPELRILCRHSDIDLDRSLTVLLAVRVCLERNRLYFQAFADRLVIADPATVREAPTAALPALDACNDLDALQAIVSLPAAPAMRGLVAASTEYACRQGTTDRPDLRARARRSRTAS